MLGGITWGRVWSECQSIAFALHHSAASDIKDVLILHLFPSMDKRLRLFKGNYAFLSHGMICQSTQQELESNPV